MNLQDRTEQLIEQFDGLPFLEVYNKTEQYISKSFRQKLDRLTGVSYRMWLNYTSGKWEPKLAFRTIYIQLLAEFMPETEVENV